MKNDGRKKGTMQEGTHRRNDVVLPGLHVHCGQLDSQGSGSNSQLLDEIAEEILQS